MIGRFFLQQINNIKCPFECIQILPKLSLGEMGQFFDNRLRKIVMVNCRKVNSYILQKMCEVHGSYLADILDAEENRFIVSLMHHTQSDLKI